MFAKLIKHVVDDNGLVKYSEDLFVSYSLPDVYVEAHVELNRLDKYQKLSIVVETEQGRKGKHITIQPAMFDNHADCYHAYEFIRNELKREFQPIRRALLGAVDESFREPLLVSVIDENTETEFMDTLVHVYSGVTDRYLDQSAKYGIEDKEAYEYMFIDIDDVVDGCFTIRHYNIPFTDFIEFYVKPSVSEKTNEEEK